LNERGAALLVTLLVGTLLAGVGAVLITLSATETLVSGAHRYVQETTYAAEAALERALLDLGAMGDWTPALRTVSSTFVDGETRPSAPDGRRLDLADLTTARQAASDRTSGPAVFGADSPRWRLYGHAAFDAVLPPGTPAQPAYLLVWVADDGWDGDGDPTADSNRRLLVAAEAFGAAGAHRRIEAVIACPADGILRVLARQAVP
jgi:hypothetical protein